MNDYAEELKIAKRLALDAGVIMLKYFNSDSSGSTIKKDKTIVTKADIEINTHVIKILNKSTPGYSIWGEEQSSIVEGSKYTWVCDPVDGTMPFAKGLQLSTFSLALVNEKGESVLGVVYDPHLDRLFEAVRGKGALLNGVTLRVSEHNALNSAYIDDELWLNENEEITFDSPKDILNKAGSLVTTQCSAVIMGSLVAQGQFDAMIFGQGKPEDIAALAVIVPEAGGQVTDLFGNSQRYDTNIRGAIVSNGKIHEQLIAVLKNINYISKYIPQVDRGIRNKFNTH